MSINPIHVELQGVAQELIAENGVTMQLVSSTTTGPAFNPVVVDTLTDIVAVRSNYNVNEVGDGSRIKSTDIKLLIASQVAPATGQKIIDGLKEMQIIDVSIIEPGEVVILYKVQVRL